MGSPKALNRGAMPRPSPSAKRPSVSLSIVVANDAVTIGWRVLWFVTPVAMPRVVVAPADRAAQRHRFLHVEAFGQEHRAEPDAFGVAHVVQQQLWIACAACQAVEAKLVQSGVIGPTWLRRRGRKRGARGAAPSSRTCRRRGRSAPTTCDAPIAMTSPDVVWRRYCHHRLVPRQMSMPAAFMAWW